MRSSLRFSIIVLLGTVLGLFCGGSAHAAADLSDRFGQEILMLGEMLDSSAYAEVLDRGQELLPMVRADFPDGSFDEAKILDFMVHACYRSRRVMDPEALEMAQRAVALKESLLGADHPELAISLMHQGNLLGRRGDRKEALPVYDRSVAILLAAGPEYDVKRATLLSSQGVVFRRLGQNKKALELYAQAQAIQERVLGPDHPDLAATLNNQGVVYSERGDYSLAEKAHRRALAIREKSLGSDHEWVGESCNNLASVLGYLGKYTEALEFQERAVAIFRDKLGTDHQRYWIAKSNLGIAYLDMGDPAGALPVCSEVLEGLRERYGPENYELCFQLDAVASCHYALGDPEKALEVYSESLAIAEKSFGEGSYETADTIEQQGKCLTDLGRLDEAVEHLNRSLAIWTEAYGPESGQLCSLLNRLAELHLRQGDFERTLELAQRSRRLTETNMGSHHPLLAEACRLEGQALRGQGNGEAALASALQAEDISRRHLQHTMRVLSEERALDYAGSRVEGLNLALAILESGEAGERVAQVWDSAIRSRSAVLDAYTERNRALTDGADPVVAALQDSSLVLRERLANLTLRGPGWDDDAVYQEMLGEAEADLNAVERQLSLKSADFRRRQQDSGLGFAEVDAALPSGSALVAFSLVQDPMGETSFLALVLPASGADPVVRDLGSAQLIDAAVASWRDQATFGVKVLGSQELDPSVDTVSRGFMQVKKSAGDQMAAYLETGATLRSLVWDPVVADLGDARQVFLVPDGSLHLVNFMSLPEKDGLFLVEEDRILHILTAEKTLTLPPSRILPGGQLLALGGADFGKDPDPSPEAMVFPPLPHTLSEVEDIGNIWSDRGGKATLLSGAQATESRLKAALGGAQVVHLATHGFFLPGSSLAETAARWDNPLVRSGLALAGANHWHHMPTGADDGILTAQEVSAIDLSAVQWAVLSACDTGLGELGRRSEGVFGLRRVFALAGARTVIMSLWQVDDEASSYWMEALYRARWQENQSTAAATRTASLATLDWRRKAGLSEHPYYWAGFVATGDWR
jgi:CHAT domain-containing protein/tetratricopeptide (TPR) repeat protein